MSGISVEVHFTTIGGVLVTVSEAAMSRQESSITGAHQVALCSQHNTNQQRIRMQPGNSITEHHYMAAGVQGTGPSLTQ
jgi:hypothetical protein